MKENPGIVERLVPSLVAWGVTKLLEAPKVKDSVRSLDREIEHRRRRAESAMKKAVNRAGDEPIPNGIWLAAGIVAFAAGVAFIAKATRKH